MKVLFLMIAYPDVSRNTNMYTDLTSEFLKDGHDVYVAAPHNNATLMNIEEGIKVLRIKTLPLFNTSIIKKGIANILLPYQYKKSLKRYFKDIYFDLVITPTPPITFIATISFLKKKNHSKIYLILRDIFPQNAKDLGIIKNPIIFNYFRRKEKKLYRIVDSIGCMSQKNIDFVYAHNKKVHLKKLHILPNWTRVNEINSSDICIRSQYNLIKKFVAVFGGNFGIPQKIDFLIEVAEKIRYKKDIFFLLVGEGTEKSKIRKIIHDKNLKNIRIIDQLPRNEYLELVKACDVGLVNLSDKFTIPNIPSRTLSYWSLKLPVIAGIDENTDYGELLEKSGGGLWSLTGDTEAYIANLISFYDNPEKRKQMGENGYNYLVKELNSEIAYKTIISRI
jgi:glycosyltransferase involved in cell wall biosynthesis